MTVPRGFTRCDECEDGLVCGCERGKQDHHPRNIAHTTFIDRFDGVPCPSCSGSGLVPTEKLREETRSAAVDAFDRSEHRSTWTWPDAVRESSDAVLAKVAEHLQEDR